MFRLLAGFTFILVLAAACSVDVLGTDGQEPTADSQTTPDGQTHDGQQSPDDQTPDGQTPDGQTPDGGNPHGPQPPEPLPSMEVTTAGGAAVESKTEYVDAVLCLTTTAGRTEAGCRIRGRGNATWNYEKKPYKIKLDEALPLCSMPADKDWVLLAEYCDKSLMRTMWMCTLSEAVGMPYTISFHHIELTLNGEYLGIYLLAEQVEKDRNRVDIAKDGFIIEDDHYWWQEPLSFSTPHRGQFTFKYPDADDEEITSSSESYFYIRDRLLSLEDALYGPDFRDPEQGYRAWLDVDTFVKWYLVNELLCNYDPNLYYVMPTRGARLMMYPLWDFEWSLGLAGRAPSGVGWASPPLTSPVDIDLWSREKYFKRLFQDPAFVEDVRTQWATLKSSLPEVKERVRKAAETISVAQNHNFERWPILDQYVAVGLIALGSWEAEVAYLENFFDRRVAWFDKFITEFGAEKPND